MRQKELLNPPTVVTLHCILLMDPGKEHMGSKGACNLPCRFKKKNIIGCTLLCLLQGYNLDCLKFN